MSKRKYLADYTSKNDEAILWMLQNYLDYIKKNFKCGDLASALRNVIDLENDCSSFEVAIQREINERKKNNA